MPNIGDTVYIRSDGTHGVVNDKGVNQGGKQYSASGAYDSIPYTNYGVRVPNLGIDQEVMDGDFTGQLGRIPTVDFNGAISLKLKDSLAPWPPKNW